MRLLRLREEEKEKEERQEAARRHFDFTEPFLQKFAQRSLSDSQGQ